MKPRQILPLVLLALIWGGYYVASQKAVEHLSVFSVGVLIRLITMLLLGIMMWKRRQIRLLFRVKAVLPRLLLIGLLGFLLDLTAFIGLTASTAGSGTALLKCDILFVNLISVVIYRERFTKRDWLYTLIMLAGVFLVMGINPFEFRIGEIGNLFFILSALFVSINAFVIKGVQLDAKHPVEDNVIAFYNNFVTMLLFLATSLVMGTFGQLLNPADRGFLIPAALAGVGQTLIYLVYYYDLRRYPVWIVKVFLLLMPIVAALIGFLLFGDTLMQNQIIGIGIVLGGAFGILTEQGRKTADKKRQPDKSEDIPVYSDKH